jgi:DegV family protein with EDD domain
MPIKIITDNAADLTPSFIAEHDIDIVDLKVHWPDGVEPPPKGDPYAFYAKMETVKTPPTTAQPSPGEFEDVFKKALDAGQQVLFVGLSSGMSGTMQSATIARSNMGNPDSIFLVDSLNATFGEQLLVKEAVRLRDLDLPPEDIVPVLEHRRELIRFHTIIGDLKYLRMGGRISASAATIGAILHVVPIVGVVEGKVTSLAKERGYQNALKRMIKMAQDEVVDERLPVMLGHTAREKEMMDFQKMCIEAGLPFENPDFCHLGPIIGAHGGPGCVGMVYFKKAPPCDKSSSLYV